MKKLLLISILWLCFQSLPAPGFVYLYILKTAEECNMLTWDNIEWYMEYYHVREPGIVKTQIKHETANLTSRFCREQNNLCGMRLARLRPTTAIGEGNRMAKYSKWQESLLDYAIYQSKYYKGGDYFLFLTKHGYATDKKYIKKLKSYDIIRKTKINYKSSN